MKNQDIVLLVIHAAPNFPEYFVHPLQKLLQEKGVFIEYIDTDSHSDDFYLDFILQSLFNKKQIFVYIQVEPEQKKLPNNCTKILSQLHKIKEKTSILCAFPNVMLQAYTRNFSFCPDYDLQKQAEYIISCIKTQC